MQSGSQTFRGLLLRTHWFSGLRTFWQRGTSPEAEKPWVRGRKKGRKATGPLLPHPTGNRGVLTTLKHKMALLSFQKELASSGNRHSTLARGLLSEHL